MNPIPDISIILPSYNYVQYISYALNSIIAQSFDNWELIIIDDASVDESLGICKKYQQKYPEKIKIISLPFNHGLAKSIVTGLKASAGRYIAFLEADDVWESESLKQKFEILEKESCSLVFTDVLLVGKSFFNKDRLEKHVNEHTRTLSPNEALDMSWIVFKNYIPTFSCVMVKKSELLKVDFDIRTNQHSLDHWVWSQLSLLDNFVYIPQKLTRWRIHDKSYGFVSSQLSAIQFSKNETQYTKELYSLLSNQCSLKHVNFKEFLSTSWNMKNENFSFTFIQKLCNQIDFYRTSDKKMCQYVVRIKDYCWRMFAQ